MSAPRMLFVVHCSDCPCIVYVREPERRFAFCAHPDAPYNEGHLQDIDGNCQPPSWCSIRGQRLVVRIAPEGT